MVRVKGLVGKGALDTKVGIALLIVMFAIFVAIRELWQKGGKPLKDIPGVSFWAIGLLIVFMAIIYYIHKKFQE